MFIKIQLFAEGEDNPPAPAPDNADKWKEAYDALLVKFNERDAELVAVRGLAARDDVRDHGARIAGARVVEKVRAELDSLRRVRAALGEEVDEAGVPLAANVDDAPELVDEL